MGGGGGAFKRDGRLGGGGGILKGGGRLSPPFGGESGTN